MVVVPPTMREDQVVALVMPTTHMEQELPDKDIMEEVVLTAFTPEDLEEVRAQQEPTVLAIALQPVVLGCNTVFLVLPPTMAEVVVPVGTNQDMRVVWLPMELALLVVVVMVVVPGTVVKLAQGKTEL
jgi:hypothetical protein